MLVCLVKSEAAISDSQVSETKAEPQLDSNLLNGLASVADLEGQIPAKSDKVITEAASSLLKGLASASAETEVLPPPKSAKVPMPPQMELPVKVYLSPEWREFDPFGSNATRTLILVDRILQDSSLDTKFKMRFVRMISMDKTGIKTSSSGHHDFSKEIEPSFKPGMIHIGLVVEGGVGEISRPSSICHRNNRKAAGLVRVGDSDEETAQNLAHSLGHIVGMHHDYEGYLGRKWTCGPSKYSGGPDNMIMNKGFPRHSKWSKCSNADFRHYYDKMVKAEGRFCLKSV